MKKTKENKKEKLTFDNAPDLLTADQACELLNISRKTLRQLTDSGELKSFMLARRVRYTKGQVKEFIYNMTGDANFMPLDEVEDFDEFEKNYRLGMESNKFSNELGD